MTDTHFAAIEQPCGPALVEPLDPQEILSRTAGVFRSYEAFLRAELASLDRGRRQNWSRDYSGVEAYERSVAPMRDRLKAMLGWWIEPGQRQPLRVTNRRELARHDRFVAYVFDLEVLPGLQTYGIELVPDSPAPRPAVLIQHGYIGTPESACGFVENANGEDYVYRSFGIRAALHGFHVIAINHPTRSGVPGGTPPPPAGTDPADIHYGKNRLHRLAVMAGGTLFGLDMLACSRAVDVLAQCEGVDPRRIGMYGLSQGGQSALFLPALDQRIQASVSSAYFTTRLDSLIGPHPTLTYLDSHEEDKFFAQVVSHFGDADLVSLIAPRAFAVEAGLRDTSVDFERARNEFHRARLHYDKLGLGDRVEFIPHAEGHVSATARAFEFLRQHLQGG